jgi:hypothetical protein
VTKKTLYFFISFYFYFFSIKKVDTNLESTYHLYKNIMKISFLITHMHNYSI